MGIEKKKLGFLRHKDLSNYYESFHLRNKKKSSQICRKIKRLKKNKFQEKISQIDMNKFTILTDLE